MPLHRIFIRFFDCGQQISARFAEGGEESALLSEVRAGGSPLFDVAAMPPAQHVGVILHDVLHVVLIGFRDGFLGLQFDAFGLGLILICAGKRVVAIDDR